MSSERDLPRFLKALFNLQPLSPTENVCYGRNEAEAAGKYDELKRAQGEIQKLSTILIGVAVHNSRWPGAVTRVNYITYEQMAKKYKVRS